VEQEYEYFGLSFCMSSVALYTVVSVLYGHVPVIL
jgi:hypothetical protein